MGHRKSINCYIPLLLGFCVLASPASSLAWWGTVRGVEAGDILTVSNDAQKQQVKLYGVNCPEKGQPFSDKSRLLVSFLTSERRVEVIPVYKGSDGFERALVKVEGQKVFLNQQLIGYGMAWVKPDECSSNFCGDWKAHQGLARKNLIGLWEERRPTPPWEWRKRRWLSLNNSNPKYTQTR